MHHRSVLLFSGALSCLFAAPALAQVSNASVTVDQFGKGCQGPNGLITGGVEVAAQLDLQYDAATGQLLVTVDNTTPVVAGESTAVITQVYLNLPKGAINTAVLVNQTGSGGANPAFTLSYDPDPSVAPNPNNIACLGDFGLCWGVQGSQGAIANPAGNTTASNPVVGPVTFEFQLAGPGAGGISAEAILASYSVGGPDHSNVALKFQSAGVGGQESGWVGSAEQCRTAVYSVGTPNIGSTIDICVTGEFGCHVCLWVSEVAGPVVVGPFTIPVGLPLLAVFTLGNLGLNGAGNEICFSVPIPNNPALVNYSLYFTNLTYYVPNPTMLSFSEAYTLTIL